jgi:hypothetical protein
MKRTMTLAIMAALLFPFLAFGQTEEYYDRSYTRLSYVQGDVYIQRAQELGYEQGEVNLVVVAGDKLGTRDGRAEIQLGRGNVLRLDRDTQIDLAGLPGRDGDPTNIHILAGSVFIRVRNADGEKDLQIHSPDASFYVLEPGLYRVDVRDNERTEFASFSGRAEAAGEEGSLEVESGEAVSAWDGRLSGGSSRLYARGDDFSSWNESRDELYARRLEKTYLPSEYADYEYELAENGDWAYEADHGYVWVPRVHYPEWRPYYDGRWSWYPVIGWTWISYEPWGWCTSHYGRWGWRFGLGWYWIPTHHWGWGPAWVHWYNDWDYIGWSPLSYWGYPCWIYNNRFYGRGHNGWHGDFRDHVRTMTVVHRNQLQDRRISRVALDGRAGIKVDRISLRAKQPDLRPSLNRDSNLDSQARRTLDRGSLRRVERNFSSGRGGLSSPQLQERNRIIKKSDSGRDIREGVVFERGGKTPPVSRSSEGEKKTVSRGNSERILRPQTESRSGGVVKRDAERSLDRGTMREYPSQSKGSLAGAAKKTFSSRDVRPALKSPTSKSGSTATDRSVRAIRERDSTSRSSSPTIRYYSGSSRLSAPTDRSSSRSRSSSSSSSYRTWGSPSEDRSRFESRSYSSPRSTGSSSRSSLSPSRSSGSSSRSFSAPSRKSSSSSRSVSSSSRSSSGSSRSSSSSSRSSTSRSSSSSSRSSSGSKSSGSVHRR